jgi:hypothetical protein
MDRLVASTNVARQVRPRHSPTTAAREGWYLEVLIAAVIGFLAWQVAAVWESQDSGISPVPAAIGQAYNGSRSITPQVLNRMQPGLADIGSIVLYVGPNLASTGPYVVSINADGSAWSAEVALGSNGRCYAELVDNRDNDGFGQDFYAEFKKGDRCMGRYATPSTMRGDDYEAWDT